MENPRVLIGYIFVSIVLAMWFTVPIVLWMIDSAVSKIHSEFELLNRRTRDIGEILEKLESVDDRLKDKL